MRGAPSYAACRTAPPPRKETAAQAPSATHSYRRQRSLRGPRRPLIPESAAVVTMGCSVLRRNGRPREPPTVAPNVREERLRHRPADRGGRAARARIGQRDLRGEGGHQAARGGAVEGRPPRVRRAGRHGGGAPRREVLLGSDGGPLPQAEGALPGHPRDRDVVLVPRRRLALQAPRRGALRRRRAPRPRARAALHAARCRRRARERSRREGGSARERGAWRRRDREGTPGGDLRDRDGGPGALCDDRRDEAVSSADEAARGAAVALRRWPRGGPTRSPSEPRPRGSRLNGRARSGNTGKVPFALSVGARSAPKSKGASIPRRVLRLRAR